jgi:outer membrane protein
MAALLLLAMGGLSYAQEMKIGFVDLSRLFDEYYKTKEYDKILEEKFNKFNDEMKDKVEKIKEQEGKLSLLSEDKKQAATEELEQAKEEAMAYEKDQKANLTKERNEKIRDILLEIEKVVKDYADKENFSIILNDRVLIYGKDTLNITDAILGALNANASGK